MKVVNINRKGGSRLDRCFKVYMKLPKGICEDKVMDLIEEAVASHVGSIGIDPETVCVRRRDPKYSEL